jgi:hypothetical protein
MGLGSERKGSLCLSICIPLVILGQRGDISRIHGLSFSTHALSLDFERGSLSHAIVIVILINLCARFIFEVDVSYLVVTHDLYRF